MGNIVNKEITKIDVCFEYIVKSLIDKHGYTIKECIHENQVLDFSLDKNIIKIGQLYIVLITDFKKDDMLIRYLVSPFAEGICKSEFVDRKYSVETIINSDFLFFAGFSHVNFCKIITFASCNLQFFGDNKYPIIDLVCAMKTDTYINDEFNDNALKEVRVNLGMIIIFKCIQYFKDKGYDRVLLECNYKLFDYYRKLFFSLGTGPDNDYNFEKKDITTAIRASLRSLTLYGDDTRFSHLLLADGFDEKIAIRNPEKAYKNALFRMYFNIDKNYKKLKREAGNRIYTIRKNIFLKTLFDSFKDHEVVKINKYYDQLMRNYESDFSHD